MRYQPLKWLLLFILVASGLSACVGSSPKLPITDSQVIESGSSFGQSFTAHNRGFSSISVMLAPAGPGNEGNLLFHLRTSPQATQDLASKRIPISDITSQAYYRFDFSAQHDSQHKDYFLLVEVEGGGQVKIFTANADAYLDGALYKNLSAQNAQLGFLLEYNRTASLLGAIMVIAGWIPVLLRGIILFILPGWALFSWLWNGWKELDWITKLGLSGALSLAIYPLFLLWSDLVGLHLGPLYAVIPPIAGLGVLVWKNRKFFSHLPDRLSHRFTAKREVNTPPAGSRLADIAFVIVLILVIASRFWIIRSLDVPLYGDSYQHTMISQLIIDHGGLFNSWEPYADLTTLTYHFGFHSMVAVYHWVSGSSVEQAMLWTGQLINILAIVSIYPLTYKLTKNRWAAVISILISGLLMSMPNYYVNWGRYTQLTGQAILPCAVWIAWSLLDRPVASAINNSIVRKLVSLRYLSIDFASLSIAWLVFGGLALTHYRILLFSILFFLGYGLIAIFRKRGISWMGRTFWIGIGGVILFVPWFVHVFGGKMMAMFVTGITTVPSELIESTTLLRNIYSLVVYVPMTIWVLMLLAVLLAIIGKHIDMIVFTAWWLFIILAANPKWLSLPGTGIITNFAVQIAFYIPAGVAVGFTLAWIVQKVCNFKLSSRFNPQPGAFRIILSSLALLVILTSGLWGLFQRIDDLDLSDYALITRPDLRAMFWIKENLPSDAKILVNSFFAYNNRVVAGSDGGWWIPLLADRKTSQPPLNYDFEMGFGSATADTANSLTRAIQEKGLGNLEIQSLLVKSGIHYIYIGQRQGSVNYSGPQVLDPEMIKSLDNFEVAYHQDRVWIFSLKP